MFSVGRARVYRNECETERAKRFLEPGRAYLVLFTGEVLTVRIVRGDHREWGIEPQQGKSPRRPLVERLSQVNAQTPLLCVERQHGIGVARPVGVENLRVFQRSSRLGAVAGVW
ncbi:MAG TPA: hypothetical protein VMM17_04005 [Gemmatimonadaceae bacterium]|nr:hypothetical protein [Gemmatimonadaceae bacterium]